MSAACSRGWRETLGDGLYRVHVIACSAGQKKRSGARCGCKYQTQVTQGPGLPSRTITFEAANPRDARAKQREEQRRARDRTGKPTGHIPLRTYYHEIYVPTRVPRWSYRHEHACARIFADHIDARLGGMLLNRIGPEDVERWVNYLAGEYERRVARGFTEARWLDKSFTVLHKALAYAKRWGRIDFNPADDIVLPSADAIAIGRSVQRDEPGDATRVITREEFALLCAEALEVPLRARPDSGLRNWLMFQFGFVHGMRNSEVRALRIPDFTLAGNNPEVRIARSIDSAPGRPEKETKTGKRRAHPLSGELVEGVERRLFWLRKNGGDAHSFLFPSDTPSLPITMGVPATAISKVQERAGLVDADGRRRIDFHGLRHSCATDLIAVANWSYPKTAAWLGHSSHEVTERVYVHLKGHASLREEADERLRGLPRTLAA